MNPRHKNARVEMPALHPSPPSISFAFKRLPSLTGPSSLMHLLLMSDYLLLLTFILHLHQCSYLSCIPPSVTEMP